MLIGLPFVLALTLATWLGTPRESLDNATVFAQLGLPEVACRQQSLAYGELLFVRLDLAPESRVAFLQALADPAFAVSRGRPQKPIALKLERDWWNPPEKQEGTLWKRDRVAIWNPDSESHAFFAVVERPVLPSP